MRKMKEGCEVEALGINYTISSSSSSSHHHHYQPFNHNNLLSCTRPRDQQEEHIPRRRVVLKDVSCRAKPWEILSIVGPSGAGKSSLLEILAGRIRPDTASIFLNRKPVQPARFKKLSGYVAQRDTLFPLLTVEETLTFTARLRLGLPRPELKSRVSLLIRELGLGHVAGARVGDAERIRGVSGGERRRVSIGVEVIHDPRVLILDEPTSGLDSTSALQTIDMLKLMAETRGRTVILSIHQPGFRILKLFNSILLLAHGSVLHRGTVDQLTARLRLIGLQPPPHVNALEFAMESIDAMLQEQTPHPETPNQTLRELFQQSKVVDEDAPIVANDPDHSVHGFPNSWTTETVILTHRFWKNIYRTRELFAFRSVQMLISGLVLGSIFFHLEDDLIGAEERVGLFAFILTFLLSSTTEALPIFLQEREILEKETSSGTYRVSSYCVANALVHLPFLLILSLLFSLPLYWLVGLNPSGATPYLYFLLIIFLILYTANSVVVCFSALVPNFIIGNSVVSAVMGSFFLFSGYFVSKSGIPDYWIFMHYMSLFKYPFEGLLINEFSGSPEKCLQRVFGKCVVTGEKVMKEEGGYGEEQSRWRNVVFMVSFILLYRLISYVILRFRCSHGRGGGGGGGRIRIDFLHNTFKTNP
ncbi:hypothetical protein DM860_013071 [Cuscuta australis]|uniref:ABC transporter domain-containing protein n=1 Tax=Cuscuta australis TaxID=267555 RepID=A0A328D459_9ASTE|nr:hypothetical protein DM860_013071 [Cuscuta australis]